jgi:AcrR family transcriptional regulator
VKRPQGKILTAAKKVFARKGMSAKMSEVATEARISQGLAYHYFPSKEAIFVALLRQMTDPSKSWKRHDNEIGFINYPRCELM